VADNLEYCGDYSKIKDKATVYVKNNLLNEFFSNLDKINGQFILVSGNCDTQVTDDVHNFIKHIESDKILHWFAQNCTSNHPKITKIPIGLDYHSLTSTGAEHWGPQQTPFDQEKDLVRINNQSNPFYKRQVKCYANFHLKMDKKRYSGDRLEAKEKIPAECIDYEPNFLLRDACWKKMIEYAFVASPHGNGLDCHRTWEALCLGCIVIVKTSPIDCLYEDLPVLIVKDWGDVTMKKLESTIEEFKHKKFNYDKLLLKYYMDKINLKSK